MRERRSRPFQRAKTKGQQSGLLVGICVKCFFFVVSAVLILCLGYLYTHHALITASSRQQLDSKLLVRGSTSWRALALSCSEQ